MEKYALFDNSFFRRKPLWLPQKLYRVVCQRSNPRSREYMTILLKETYPNAKLTEIEKVPPEIKEIILLYPDSIGLGWLNMERNSLKRFKTVTVLNGRKRGFSLTNKTQRELLLRRFLETTFLSELLLTPFLLLAGTFLAIKDWMAGRS